MRTKDNGRAAFLLHSKWVCLLFLVVFTAIISGCPKPPPPITPEPTPTPTPTPKPEPEVILRLHGSRTIGENLMPDLVEAFLESEIGKTPADFRQGLGHELVAVPIALR